MDLFHDEHNLPVPDPVDIPRWEVRTCRSPTGGFSHYFVDRLTGKQCTTPQQMMQASSPASTPASSPSSTPASSPQPVKKF
ncbi:hypothetical protein BWQ96_04788 [Gracilariopsis chorda]|uniref:Uncharacterized protein n=1 Tax=Gracilariopsis chorda TaxID=448386 RepID=A0A2V3IWI0_9FLOR|nr:hypothetical protein BWQ96_04788 [Gracilariopsis chorda]|eukprot:PXF45490.1 hypothetical protein BWQ96_04788 [Gracilariopsis chorda]